jgi:malate/lactate dehydrogenase
MTDGIGHGQHGQTERQGDAQQADPHIGEGGSQHSRFFSQPMRLGKEGWYKVLPYGPLTQAEKDALEAMLPTLRDEIRMGEEFVLKPE